MIAKLEVTLAINT